MANRIAIVINRHGEPELVCSDEPVRVFIVSDHTPDDRVYEWEDGEGCLRVGVEHVQAVLKDSPIGHANDGHFLGRNLGPRRKPSRPSLELVKSGDAL